MTEKTRRVRKPISQPGSTEIAPGVRLKQLWYSTGVKLQIKQFNPLEVKLGGLVELDEFVDPKEAINLLKDMIDNDVKTHMDEKLEEWRAHLLDE